MVSYVTVHFRVESCQSLILQVGLYIARFLSCRIAGLIYLQDFWPAVSLV